MSLIQTQKLTPKITLCSNANLIHTDGQFETQFQTQWNVFKWFFDLEIAARVWIGNFTTFWSRTSG